MLCCAYKIDDALLSINIYFFFSRHPKSGWTKIAVDVVRALRCWIKCHLAKRSALKCLTVRRNYYGSWRCKLDFSRTINWCVKRIAHWILAPLLRLYLFIYFIYIFFSKREISPFFLLSRSNTRTLNRAL